MGGYPREGLSSTSRAKSHRLVAMIPEEIGDAAHAPTKTAEDSLQRRESYWPNLAGEEPWIEIKALVAGVRKHGTYKKYVRAPHRDVLAVRGLAQRGKLEVPLWPTVRTGQLFGELSTEHRALHFLARLGDNGVCWHILSFWRATY